MSKLVPAGRRMTRPAGRFVYSCAVPVGRWWPARYTQTGSPTGVLDALPERVDHTHRLGWELPPETAALHRRRSQAGLPVGGVDAGDDDADTDFARPRFGQIAIDELQNRRVTRTRVDDRFHARDNRVILWIIPSQVGAVR